MKRIADSRKSEKQILEILFSMVSGDFLVEEAVKKHGIPRRTLIAWLRRYKTHLDEYLVQKKEQRAGEIASHALRLVNFCPPRS